MLTRNGIISENITGRYAHQSDLDRAREALRRATEYEIERIKEGMPVMPAHELAAAEREIKRLRATIQ